MNAVTLVARRYRATLPGVALHADAPALKEYVPAPHAAHTAADVAPVLGEKVPAPHGTHALAPALEEYVPAGHAMHAMVPTDCDE